MKVKCFDPMNTTFSTWMAEYKKNEKITADIQIEGKIYKNLKYEDFMKITPNFCMIDIRKFNYSNHKENFRFNRIWKKVFITFI